MTDGFNFKRDGRELQLMAWDPKVLVGKPAALPDIEAALAERGLCVVTKGRHDWVLAEEVTKRDEEIARLGQVALEAMRLVAGKGSPAEPCGECGMPGIGPMRDALRKAFGPDWGRLIWGNDGNAAPEFKAVLAELALRVVSKVGTEQTDG